MAALMRSVDDRREEGVITGSVNDVLDGPVISTNPESTEQLKSLFRIEEDIIYSTESKYHL
jgi:hypothetical protein